VLLKRQVWPVTKRVITKGHALALHHRRISAALLTVVLIVIAGIIWRPDLAVKKKLIQVKQQKTLAFQPNLLKPGSFYALAPQGSMSIELQKNRQNVTVGVSREKNSLEFALPWSDAQVIHEGKRVVYNSPSQKMSARYELLSNGIKEDLIFEAAPKTNTFRVPFKNSGLLAQQHGNTVIFYDQNGQYQYHLQPPFMKDQNGQVSYAVQFALEDQAVGNNATSTATKDEEIDYQGPFKIDLLTSYDPQPISTEQVLVITYNLEWLQHPDRVYPIYLDPTIIHDEASEFAGEYNRAKNVENYLEPAVDANTVALWRMNELANDTCLGSLDACDISGNGNHAGIGAGTEIRPGQLNLARYFDQTDDYLSVADSASLDITGSITIEAWIKPKDTSGAAYQTIIGKRDGSVVENNYALRLFGDEVEFYYANSGNWHVYETSNANVASGTWTHIAATFDAANLPKIYKNGELQTGSCISNTCTAALLADDNIVGIGRPGVPTYQPFGGLIDELRLSNVARTPQEIAAASLNRPKIETFYQDLAADGYTAGLWRMNESANGTCSGGGDVCDASSNALHGTVTGTTISTGFLNSARDFRGGTDTVALGNPNALKILGNQTIEAWVFPTSFASRQNIFHKAYGGEGSMVQEVNGTLNYYYGTAGANNTPYQAIGSLVAIPLNTWTHLALVRNLDDMTLTWYINGQVTNSIAASYPAAVASSLNASIGSGYTTSYVGLIDEVRISTVARSPEEIKASVSRRPYSIYTSPTLDLTSNLSRVAVLDTLQWTAEGLKTGDGETASSSAGLVAQWNFNETSGTTADNSEGTAALDGTLTNFADTSGQDVAIGSGWTSNNKRWGAGALMFDGIDDYGVVTQNAAINVNQNSAFSFETWVKPTASGRVIANKQQNVTNEFVWGVVFNATNQFAFSLSKQNVSGVNATSAHTFPVGMWYHVVGVSDGINFFIFVNGQLEGSATINFSSATQSVANLFIGQNYNNTSRWQGTIDSTRIYNRALPASEILSNYNAGSIEFQTRTSADGSTWEDWRPVTGETVISSLDNAEPWQIDTNQNASANISKISSVNLGTGADGACIMDNGIKTLDSTAGSSVCNSSGRSTAYAVNFSVTSLAKAGDTSVTVSATPTGLAVGDEILIINQQGTTTNYESVGKYETHVISSIDTNTLYFTDSPLRNNYDGTTQKIMVQRIPNFGNVTICGGATGGGCTAAATLTTSAWDGTKGGVLFFRSTGTVTIDSGGTITATGLGYRGGSTATTNVDYSYGYAGERVSGVSTAIQTSSAAIYGGGGGAGKGAEGSGGGGGLGSSGVNGAKNLASSDYGRGAVHWGQEGDSRLLFGGGGGSAGSHSGGRIGAAGGAGGGIILIAADTLGSTTIVSNGSPGTDGVFALDANSGAGGGGGAGGDIVLMANSITNTTTTATGGAGGTKGVGTNGFNGGAGASGRVAEFYTTSLSGTTTPLAFTKKLQSVVKTEGSSSAQFQFGSAQNDTTVVGLWHLDETGGSSAYLKDYSGNANHGTPTGTTTADGFAGKGRRLVTNDYISHPVSGFVPASKSIEMWVKPDWNWNDGVAHGLWQNNDSTSYNAANWVSLFKWTGNQLYFRVVTPAGTLQDCAPAATNFFLIGEWTHVVATYDAGGLALYVNGALVCSTSSTTVPTANLDTNARIGFGHLNTFGNGIIDEVKISNKKMTADEVTAAYRIGREQHLSLSIPSTNLSTQNKIPFYVASDRLGTYLEATIGESAFANNEPDGNTVGLWHLEEQAGTGAYLKDNSSNNHGTPGGNAAAVQGKIGKGRRFDGAGDFINVGTAPSLDFGNNGPFTIAGWIRPTTLVNYASFVSKDTAGRAAPYSYMTVFMADGRVSAYTGSNWLDLCPAGSVSNNNWYHVAYVYDGTTISAYVNGLHCGSYAFAYTDNPAHEVTIGSWYGGAATYDFNGIIDEVSISNIPRTAEEIRQAYEVGNRSHPITIDFKASLDSGNLIANTSDTTFTVNAQTHGLPSKGSNLFIGDKIIVKENYDGTEYLAQGTVTSVVTSTGAVTIASWDAGSTVPSSGFTVNATVFKWQREYFDPTGGLTTNRDATTNLTIRATDLTEGFSLYLDDLKSSSGYLNNPVSSAITSTANRYFQYRAIIGSNDVAVSPQLSEVTLNYTVNNRPNIPALDSPTDTQTSVSRYPVLLTTGTDPESDALKYKINLCTDAAMTQNCQTFDQTASTTGWSAASYASGVQAIYTIQTTLNWDTTYYWKSLAIDDAGSEVWGNTQTTPYSFTVNRTPSAPTGLEAEGATNPTSVVDPIPEFSAIYDDQDTSDTALAYQLEVNAQSDFAGTVLWDSGKVTISPLAEGARSDLIVYDGSSLSPAITYYWRIRFWDSYDVQGAWNSASASFTTAGLPTGLSCRIEEGTFDSQIVVNWDNLDAGFPADYELEKNVDGAGFSNLAYPDVLESSYLDTAVTTDHTYQYRIRINTGTTYTDWCTTAVHTLNTGVIMFENVNFD